MSYSSFLNIQADFKYPKIIKKFTKMFSKRKLILKKEKRGGIYIKKSIPRERGGGGILYKKIQFERGEDVKRGVSKLSDQLLDPDVPTLPSQNKLKISPKKLPFVILSITKYISFLKIKI